MLRTAITSPADPAPQYASWTDSQQPTGSGSPPPTLWTRFTSKQKAFGIGGIALAVFICACCGIGGIVGSEDNKAPSKHAPGNSRSETKAPEPHISLSKPGELLGEGQVTSISSGNSIEVSLSGESRQVHLVGIEAPHIESGQCWATESKEFAQQKLNGKIIQLYIGLGEQKPAEDVVIDAYAVLPSGENYLESALEAGTGKMDTGAKMLNLTEIFTAAQNRASDAKQGLWGQACNGDLAPVPVTVPSTLQPTNSSPVKAVPHPAKSQQVGAPKPSK